MLTDMQHISLPDLLRLERESMALPVFNSRCLVEGKRSICSQTHGRTRTVKHSGFVLQWKTLMPAHLDGWSGRCLIA